MAKTLFLAFLGVLCLHQAAGASLRGSNKVVSAIDSPIIKAKMEQLYGGKIDTEKLKGSWERDPWSTFKTVIGSKPFFDRLQLKRNGATHGHTRVDGIELVQKKKRADPEEEEALVLGGVPLTTADDLQALQESLTQKANDAPDVLQELLFGEDATGTTQEIVDNLQEAVLNGDTGAWNENVKKAKLEGDATLRAIHEALGLNLETWFTPEQLAAMDKPKETPPLVEGMQEVQGMFKIYDDYIKNKEQIDHNLEKGAATSSARETKAAEIVYELVKSGKIWPAMENWANPDVWTVPIEDTAGGAAFFAKPENALEVPETLTEFADIKDWLEGRI